MIKFYNGRSLEFNEKKEPKCTTNEIKTRLSGNNKQK